MPRFFAGLAIGISDSPSSNSCMVTFFEWRKALVDVLETLPLLECAVREQEKQKAEKKEKNNREKRNDEPKEVF